MKILTIAATPYFSSRGCHIRIFLEAKYFEKMGDEVSLCTYHLGNKVGSFEIKRIGNVSWYKKIDPGFSWGKPWIDLKLLFLCIKQIKEKKPDIIHAHLFEGFAIGYLAKVFSAEYDIPIVLDLQGDLKSELESYNKDSNKFLKSFFVWLSKKIINKASAIVVSSENAVRAIKDNYNTKREVEIVKDGIDLELLEESNATSAEIETEMEKIESWKGNDRLLVYTGGMDDSKGVGSLLEEFLRNEKSFKNWKLILLGEGKDKKKYIELIKKNNARSRVMFTRETGFFALYNFLKLADTTIDPKRGSTESSGKLANYMASRLPIVCFENEFNRSRLGNKGFYLKEMSQLGEILQQKFPQKVEYDLRLIDSKKEVAHLRRIFEKAINEKQKS